MSPTAFKWLLNLWPPYLFAGIRVVELKPDYSHVRVRLRRHWFNRNYFGTHFGGSLFAMTDPFLALLGVNRIGKGYRIWDKAASISFEKATREDVFAEFSMPDELVERIRSESADGEPWLEWFEVDVTTGDGEIVAHVRKQLYVRRARSRP